MGKLILILLWVMPMTVTSQDSKQNKKTKETAAVLDFKSTGGLDKNESITLTNSFRSALTKTKVYEVLERSEMESLMKEQDMSLSDLCDNADCAVEVGRLLVAKKMIVGEIGKVGQTYSLTVRIIDVSSGKIEKTENESYKGNRDGLIQVFNVLAAKITGTYKSSKLLIYMMGIPAAYAGAALVFGLPPFGKSANKGIFQDPPVILPQE